MLGYAIGALFWETAGLWLIHLLHVPLEQVEALAPNYSAHAYLIMVQGATPIPYKLVTIASGLAGVPFPLFMLYSAITRSLRFVVMEALLVHFFGETGQRAAGEISGNRADRIFLLVVLGFVSPALPLTLSPVLTRSTFCNRPARARLRRSRAAARQG